MPEVDTVVEMEHLKAVAFEQAMDDPLQLDCRKLADDFEVALKAAAEGSVEHRVYRLLRDLCLMHFKPHDTAEPFGPMFQGPEGRSAIGRDFKGRQSEILAELAPTISNPALRAHLADVAWFNERRLAASGLLAVSSYMECVNRLLDGTGHLRFEDRNGWASTPIDMLRRAMIVAIALGRAKPEHDAVAALVGVVRQASHTAQDIRGYWRAADLDLDFRVTDQATIAAEIEEFAEGAFTRGNFDDAKDLFELGERAFQYADDGDGVSRVGLRIADCLEMWADATKHSPMTESHWLQQTYAKLRTIKGTQVRRKAVQGRLTGVQANIRDEMGVFSQPVDISDIVDASIKRVAGHSLIRALGYFACLGESPDPAKLRAKACESAQASPLMAFIGGSIHDDDGQMVGKVSAVKSLSDPDDEGLISIMLRESSVRRSLLVSGGISPARRVIVSEHPIDDSDLLLLMGMSGFIPSGREHIYARGFARFFGGDFISAFQTLYPQMENSLRYILKQTGFDVSTIKPDLTQESLTLSMMLSDYRGHLEKAFGPAIVLDIDFLFNRRGGPSLRHSAAHGLMDAGSFYSPDVIYACWLMFRLCLLPMLADWVEVERYCNDAL